METFDPRTHLLFPAGATEADIQLVATCIDFEGASYVSAESTRKTVTPADAAENLELTVSSLGTNSTTP